MQFVLEMAGGIADIACETWVARDLNLAAPVEPDSKIYIPFDNDPECGMGGAEGATSDTGGETGGVVPDTAGRCFDGKININLASVQVLEELPGGGSHIFADTYCDDNDEAWRALGSVSPYIDAALQLIENRRAKK